MLLFLLLLSPDRTIFLASRGFMFLQPDGGLFEIESHEKKGEEEDEFIDQNTPRCVAKRIFVERFV